MVSSEKVEKLYYVTIQWSYGDPKEFDQTSSMPVAQLSKAIQMKELSFKYLIAMLSTSFFGRSGIYKHFLKIHKLALYSTGLTLPI